MKLYTSHLPNTWPGWEMKPLWLRVGTKQGHLLTRPVILAKGRMKWTKWMRWWWRNWWNENGRIPEKNLPTIYTRSSQVKLQSTINSWAVSIECTQSPEDETSSYLITRPRAIHPEENNLVHMLNVITNTHTLLSGHTKFLVEVMGMRILSNSNWMMYLAKW